MKIDQLSGTGSMPAAQPAVAGRAPPRASQADAATAGRAEAAGAPANDAARDDARRAVAEANRRLAQKASELTFEFDDDAGRVVVRLVDTQTREVLRQIPSEEVLEIARALQDEAAAGALLRTDA